MARSRTTVSIRLKPVDDLRNIVSKDQSPVSRLFDSETASRAKIVECALEVAAWCVSGEFGKNLIDAYAPAFKQRLHEVDRFAYIRGAAAAAKFLGATAEIDPERGIITLHPPTEFQDVGTGEIDSKPLVEPEIPVFH